MTAKLSLLAATLVLISLASCQTVKTKYKPGDETAAQPTGFQPGTFVAPLRHETGQYTDLFSPASYALWVGPEVMLFKEEMAKQAGDTIDPRMETDAERIAKSFLVLECHIESAFSDSSIAYDVVGFRGIQDVYLLLPDGRKVRPEQTVMDPKAEEEPKGALKLFRRTNLLIFPTQNLWTGAPVLDPSASSVRLVLEGYDSRFFFEWPAAPGTVVPKRWAPTPEEAMLALKTGYTQLYTRVRELAHLFD